jgi:mono/diheme cytochrome c family protein
MHAWKFISVAVILLIVSTFAVAQEKAPAEGAPTVKHVPITNTSPASGKDMFDSYCAVCHGKDGKGDGPAASALKIPPANLTELARKSGGKYPAAHVASVLRGQADLAPHGNKEMPVWGPLFGSISKGQEGMVQERISNLVNYIETLQQK